jgi:hypothetical protein
MAAMVSEALTLSTLRRALVALAAAVLTLVAAPAWAVPTVTTTMALDGPLKVGEYAWDADGVPPGKVEIVADITAMRLYVYQGGVEIGRTLLMYGADDKPTPTGHFTVLQKKVHHISNLYGAPMPYMMRLTWDGIAIHGSGATVDGQRYATHGCIGVPDEFAALLFRVVKLGTQVTVTKRWLPHVYGN